MTAITSMGGDLIKLHVNVKYDIRVEDAGHVVFSATFPEGAGGVPGKSKIHLLYYKSIIESYLLYGLLGN